MSNSRHPADPFRDRVPTTDVPPSATFPRTLRLPSSDEEKRGIAVAYAPANFAVYRAIIERLQPDERFRMETQFGVFEMSRREFEESFPGITASRSYRTGSDSMPNNCYYVVGPPPAVSVRFLVR